MPIYVSKGGGGGTDIDSLVEKVAPVVADVLMIEDSADGNKKKKVKLENLALPDVGCRVYNNAAITTVDLTAKTLTFNSERWDTDSIHSTVANTDRLTCQTAGKYYIWAGVYWESGNVTARAVRIFLNGATLLAVESIPGDASPGVASHAVSTIYDLDVGHYITIVVQQTSGGGLDVLSLANLSPEVAMQLLAQT